MNRQSTIAAVLLIFLFSLTLQVQTANANPVIPSPINIGSPENYKVYPSNNVDFNFTFSGTGNVSSLAYSIDGQEPKTANQSLTLTNLPSGSHTMRVLVNFTYAESGTIHQHVDTIFFSVVYSTQGIVIALILGLAVFVISLLVFFSHKQLAARFKREKSGSFWVGISIFSLFTLVFVVLAFGWSYNYLYPPTNDHVFVINNTLLFVPTTALMVVGAFLIWYGTRKNTTT